MKCKSCGTIIDAKLKFALTQNTCPYCGEAIMEDNLKNIISGLSSILSSYENFKEQVESWLLANYNLVSLSSDKLKELLPEPIKQSFIDEAMNKFKNDVKSNLIVVKDNEIDKEKTEIKLKSEKDSADFFQRAGIKEIPSKPDEKNRHLKSVLEKIQGETIEEVDSEYQNEDFSETLEEDFKSSESFKNILNSASTTKEARDLAALERLVSKSRNPPSFKR